MSSNPQNQANIQALYTQYQQAVQQIQSYEQQEFQIKDIISEFQANLQTIKGLDTYPDDGEIIVPLGGLVFLKAKLSGIKEILVKTGSEVIVPSTLEKATEVLEQRIEEFKSYLQKIGDEKSQLENITQTLGNQLNQIR